MAIEMPGFCNGEDAEIFGHRVIISVNCGSVICKGARCSVPFGSAPATFGAFYVQGVVVSTDLFFDFQFALKSDPARGFTGNLPVCMLRPGPRKRLIKPSSRKL